MIEVERAFALLQFGDSFFPSGAASFSWGLETLRADGRLPGAAEVESFIAGQLRRRWASFDRPAVIAAHRALGDLDTIAETDRTVDAATLAREAREGGRRIGGALLKVHAEIATPGAGAYREKVLAGEAPGQLAAVQGLVGHALGLSEDETAAMAAYGLAVGIVGAALRVGALGHVDGQRILSRQRALVAELSDAPAGALAGIQAYTPMAEIAMMRHETGSGRLFAN
jgi:urease accessory protein